MDREKVIKGLEKCKRCECDDCTEKGASHAPWDCPAYDDFVDSAIALLKKSEPIAPIIKQDMNDYTSDIEQIYFCGACQYRVYKSKKYCANCGRAVRWK